MEKELFSLNDVERETGLSRKILYRLVESNKLPCFRLGNPFKIYITDEQLEKLKNKEYLLSINKKYRPSKINIYKDCVGVIANNTKNEFIFDLNILPKLKGHAWRESNKGYLVRRPIDGIMCAHHLVIGKPPIGYCVDHRDRNKKNCRSSNLRITTHQINAINRGKQRNKRGYKGVSWDKKSKRWHAEIMVNGQRIYLGSFNTDKEAVIARDRAVIKYHGMDGITNKKLGLI